jgi:hypothetical protein
MGGSDPTYEVLKLWGWCLKITTRHSQRGHEGFYRLRLIADECMTMMEKTFKHGMNVGKSTGGGKCTRTHGIRS